MVALVTPMAVDGTLDFDALTRLIDFHIEQGTDALVIVGTTGESATLDTDEHGEVIRFAVQQVAGRVPVVAGTGANATREAIELTAHAQRVGADACLLVTPYYNKPTQEGLVRHFTAVAEAVAIPQILYNVPGRTGCDMLPETIARLAGVPNIAGIKEATGDLRRVTALRHSCPAEFALYSGDDATAAEFCLMGGHGVISVTANVAPKAMHALCRAAMDGDRAAAEAIDASLSGLHHALFVESNPIPVKWALHAMGLIDCGIRLPLTWLSPHCEDTVRQAMRQAGIA